ncbi:MAG TPA: GNAT family N-acetyltransferase [Acidimicrobiales bacterium]|nr:GNAT family N-acetyltransferase [Acidimicrobiales bacterium]
MIRVHAAKEVTEELVNAIVQLLPQLSSSSGTPTLRQLEEIVGGPATVLLVARDGSREPSADAEAGDGAIVGMLTLVTFRTPTGVRAWVEDVVVDASARGRGVGEALVAAALELAAARGAQTVDLTSRPSREAANRLYQRVGFEQRQTNVYRFDLRAGD